jgi:prophage tail gpP-like protein
MADDIFRQSRDVKCRVVLPKSGVTAIIDPDSRQTSSTVFPAFEWSVTDDVLNVADAASFSVANIDGDNLEKFQPGQLVRMDVQDPDVSSDWVTHFTGRITSVETGSDVGGGSKISVNAMDLGWHLTSCFAKPLLKLKGITLGDLVKKLVDSSWGLSEDVSFSNEENRKLKQGRLGASLQFIPPKQQGLIFIQVEPGMKPWDVLQQYVQREGFLLNVGAKGQLLLIRPKYDSDSPYMGIEYHGSDDSRRSRNNVVGRPSKRETIDGLYTFTELWSTVVKPLNVQETEKGGLNPNAAYRHEEYRPSNNPLPFTRRAVYSDSEAINQDMRKMRARWNHQMNEFNSWEYTCEVPRLSSGGAFYVSDTMISVSDTVNGVEGSYYVQRVQRSYTREQKRRTKFLLRKPGLLDPTLQAQVGGGGKKSSKPQQAKP